MRHFFVLIFAILFFLTSAHAIDQPEWVSDEAWATPQIFKHEALLNKWQASKIILPNSVPYLVMCKASVGGDYDFFAKPDLQLKISFDQKQQFDFHYNNSSTVFFNFPGHHLNTGTRLSIGVVDNDLGRDDHIGSVKGIFHGEYPFILYSEFVQVSCYDFNKAQLEAWYNVISHSLEFQLSLVQQSIRVYKNLPDWGYQQTGIAEIVKTVNEMAALLSWDDPKLQPWIGLLEQLHQEWLASVEASVDEIVAKLPVSGSWVKTANDEVELRFDDMLCGDLAVKAYAGHSNVQLKPLLAQSKIHCVYVVEVKNISYKMFRVTHLPSWIGRMKHFSVLSPSGQSTELNILAVEGDGIETGKQTHYLQPDQVIKVAFIAKKPVASPLLLR
ncbi:MAG: hypothetical protein HOM11_08405, partial [Methylococcales bacterium]|nr:hypothetical protein [Methylococcales bacterium]